MGYWLTIGAAIVSTLVVLPLAVADEWDDAAESVVRLPPADFKRVPSTVVKQLAAEGCSIPQANAFESGRHNVIRGRFAARRQVDYAALCSKQGISHIMVVWGGPARCPSHIEEGDDKSALQTYTRGIVYSRAIFPASQKEIKYFQAELDGPKPPDRLHEGITDNFLGKASVILYCAEGQWHTFQGMD